MWSHIDTIAKGPLEPAMKALESHGDTSWYSLYIGTVIAILEYKVIKKRTNATAFEGG